MMAGLAVLAVAGSVVTGGGPALMPWPASLEIELDEHAALAIDVSFRVVVSGRGGPLVDRAARRFERRLARQTGLLLSAARTASEGPALEIHCERSGRPLPHLGMDESYTLEVDAARARLRAAEPWGVLRGLETFLQLVSPGRSREFFVPRVVIEDAPRFAWRGLLLDSCRHYMAIDTVERTLDGMAAVKLNVLHWHLTEDQGFRVESRRHPELHRKGSDGLFYTQDDVRRVVAHAAERGIRVVPEFDMPGHTTSWFVSHPELAADPGPYAIERRFGIFVPAMDPSKEEVYRLLDSFLGEMAQVFPDEYLHVGGDEVEGSAWNRSSALAAFKARMGFADDHDLQAYFNERVARIVRRHGKQMMGWDEILHPRLPKETVIHSWRGPEGLARAARLGFRGVLSNGYYVDLVWPAARHYAVDPHGKGGDALDERERARILGGEATMWAEYVSDETVDSRIWPRTAAIAERLWSPREKTDVDDMYARLAATSRWLEWLGLEHRDGPRRMLGRLAGAQADRLQKLAAVVEPLEDYQRGGTRAYTQQTPLNRLVDAVPPESEEARAFDRLVDALLRDPARRAGRAELRQRLLDWQGLEGELRPLVESAALTRELVPLVGEASALATAGLEALGYLEHDAAAPAEWRDARTPLLERPRNPAHALEVAFRPSVKRLVEAVRRD